MLRVLSEIETDDREARLWFEGALRIHLLEIPFALYLSFSRIYYYYYYYFSIVSEALTQFKIDSLVNFPKLSRISIFTQIELYLVNNVEAIIPLR